MGQEKVYIYKAPESRKLTEVKWVNPGLTVAGLVVLFGVALGLRLYHLTSRSFWLDEAEDVILAHNATFLESLTFHRTYVVHPPLFFAVMHLWTKFFGMAEFNLRIFSVLCDLANLGLVYYIARRWLSQRIALTTLFLLAVSPLMLNWAQSIRPYAWFSLIVTVSMFAGLLVSEKPEQTWRWVLYGSSAVVMIYAHYTGFHVIFAQTVFLGLVFIKHWKILLRLGITQALVGLCFLPYLNNFLEQNRLGPTFYVNQGFEQLAQTLEYMAVWYIPNSLKSLVGAVFYALFVVGMVWLWRNRRHLAIWLFSWSLLPLFTSWLSSLIRPNFRAEIFSLSIPAFLMTIAVGLWQTKGPLLQLRKSTIIKVEFRPVPWLLLGAALVLSMVGWYLYDKYNENQDWRSAVNYVVNNRQEGDLIFLANDYGYTNWPFDYYYRYLLGSPGNLERRSFAASVSDEEIEKLFNNYKRVWVVSSYDFDASVQYAIRVTNIVGQSFNSKFYKEYPGTQGKIGLSLFEKK